MDRDALVLSHLYIVDVIVKAKVRRGLPQTVLFDDLVQAGRIGLIAAADRYDEARRCKFKTFAQYHIEGAVTDAMRAHDPLSRQMRAERMASGDRRGVNRQLSSFDEDEADWCADTPRPDARDGVASRWLRRALVALDPRLRRVVVMHDLGGVFLRDVGAALGVNQSRASQLRSKALQHLRESAEAWEP